MDERGANIDLLFRNGLKDYEVLPPQDVWENIQPMVKKRAVIAVFLRAAAITVLVTSISIVAYFLGTGQGMNRTSFASLSISESTPVRMPATSPITEFYTPASDGSESFTAVVDDTTSPLPGEKIIERDNEKEEDFSSLSSLEKIKIGIGIRSGMSGGIPAIDPYMKTSSGRKWSVAALASPTYYSGMGARQASAEKPVISYSGGFSVAYRLNRRLSVQTGLYYASNGQKVDGISSFAGFGKYGYTKGSSNFQISTNSGPVFINNPDVFLLDAASGNRVMTSFTSDVFDPVKASLSYMSGTIIQNFNYLEMPILVKYKIIDKTLGVNIIGGISYDILLGNSVYARTGEGKYQVGSTSGMNNLTFTSSLGMGMEYSLSNRISLNLEPTFRYFLKPVNEFANPAFHPYSFGVFSGFSYKF